jgi:hypothetical protein
VISWVLGITILTTMSAPADTQDPCPAGRPARLISNVVPVLGQSPMWAATGGQSIDWESPAEPARVLWLRDVAVKGPAFLTAKLFGKSTSAAKVGFATSLYGSREQRLKLDHMGTKPAGIKDADFQKYAFHWTFVWFPSPGCYEMTGRVGSQQSVIYLNVAPAAKKRK